MDSEQGMNLLSILERLNCLQTMTNTKYIVFDLKLICSCRRYDYIYRHLPNFQELLPLHQLEPFVNNFADFVYSDRIRSSYTILDA